MPPLRRLSLFLWVVAAHSIFVGLVLMFQPALLIRIMGFAEIRESFFPCQGGVFHVVLAGVYIYGAIDPRKNKNMVVYAILVKMAATVFLYAYYFFIKSLWIVFLSGTIDFFMGAVIWFLMRQASDQIEARQRTAS